MPRVGMREGMNCHFERRFLPREISLSRREISHPANIAGFEMTSSWAGVFWATKQSPNLSWWLLRFARN